MRGWREWSLQQVRRESDFRSMRKIALCVEPMRIEEAQGRRTRARKERRANIADLPHQNTKVFHFCVLGMGRALAVFLTD